MGHLLAGRNSPVGDYVMLIPLPSRPISLLRFQICRLVTPESFIQIRFTSSLMHEQDLQRFATRLPN